MKIAIQKVRKDLQYSETPKCDETSPHLGVSHYYMLCKAYGGAGARGVRHAVAMSNVDTEPLSNYEQPLLIHEHGAGLSRRRRCVMSLTDTGTHIIRGKAKRSLCCK